MKASERSVKYVQPYRMAAYLFVAWTACWFGFRTVTGSWSGGAVVPDDVQLWYWAVAKTVVWVVLPLVVLRRLLGHAMRGGT